jgi:hypothetical protein
MIAPRPAATLAYAILVPQETIARSAAYLQLLCSG